MNLLKIIIILFNCFLLCRCTNECLLVETRPIKNGGKTEVFNCLEKGEKIVKEYRYWDGDTLQSLITWKEGDSIKNAESFFKNGKLEAKWKIVNGQEEGQISCWHSNGLLKRVTTVNNGEYNGKFVEYHENGDTLFIGNFKNGKKEGLHETYHKDGTYTKFNYFRDSLDGEFVDKFWDDEKEDFVIIYGEYQNGEKSGNWIWKDEGDNIIRDENYISGELNGIVKIFHKNGKQKIEANYIKDDVTGDYKYWNEKGELKEHKVYKENEVVKVIKEHSHEQSAKRQ